MEITKCVSSQKSDCTACTKISAFVVNLLTFVDINWVILLSFYTHFRVLIYFIIFFLILKIKKNYIFAKMEFYTIFIYFQVFSFTQL